MKPIFFVIAVIFLSACSQPPVKRHTYIDSNVTVNDTLFLRRDVKNDSVFQAIYVDPDKNSKVYNYQYALNNQDSINIKEYFDTLRKQHATLQKFDIYDLASTWRPVYQYKSKYYLYEPTGSMGKVAEVLTDSLMMLSSVEGYTPFAIGSFTKISNRIFNIKFTHVILGFEGMPKGINIYVLDKTNKLSVWEYVLPGDNRFWYQLMIPKENARQYPIIINRAEYMRQAEYEGFDKLDFKKIIAGIKQK